MRDGAVLIGFLAPLTDPEGIERLQASGVTAFAMESIPRITRAQPIDALSSQATVAGYKAALLAADQLPRFFPMLMTAAGTVAPAKVLVLGAGVAGLQAIATARRLGAVVTGFDVRPVVKEQVESLGATFLELSVRGEETEGGYAKELTPEQQAQQQQELAERIAEFDAVVTTALVPGRPAPRLIPASAVEAMRPGSVIVDLAAEAGGNCELTTPGEITVEHDVTIVGLTNLAVDDAVPREPALLAQRHRVAAAARRGRRAEARLVGRDHQRRLRRRQTGGGCVSAQFVTELTILMLAIFLGFEVISKVPTLLHTPLMSGTNAIHGIVIVGAIIVTGAHHPGLFMKIVCFVAIVLATANVVGGFVVTDRMLEMFKKRRDAAVSQNTANLLYLIPMAAFILALHFLSSPRHARLGNQIGAIGMLVAIVVTLFKEDVVTGWWIMLAGGIVGTVIGVVGARKVKMTAMPQMVALFNGVGGGAAALVSVVEFHSVWANVGDVGVERGVATVLSALIGSISFAGSMVAFGKLQELISGRPITYPGHAVRQRRRLRRRGRRSEPGRWSTSASGRSSRWSAWPRSSASCSCSRSAARTCRS